MDPYITDRCLLYKNNIEEEQQIMGKIIVCGSRSYALFRVFAIFCIMILITPFLLAGCGQNGSAGSGSGAGSAGSGGSGAGPEGIAAFEQHKTGSMELEYADQFRADYLEDGLTAVYIEDGLSYLLTPGELPAWVTGDMTEDMTVIKTPAASMYLAASSGMDLVDVLGGLGSVSMTSTQASDWADENIRELVESDTIRYIGKYRAPDFEALVEGEADLAVESTMIYHDPDVKEAIEELGIPVLVERSSYESEPLGRLEWVKLYGLLLGKENEAEAFFKEASGKASSVDTSAITETPSVAFFSVNSAGAVVVRKPGDYITKMIETAGGSYALNGITDEDDNALSTMNMQMEAFYDKAVSSDILIYNSAIEEDIDEISDLTSLSDKFRDFKAVKSGNVWCTNRNVSQKVSGMADMIVEMNRIFAGAESDEGFEYFHKLK